MGGRALFLAAGCDFFSRTGGFFANFCNIFNRKLYFLTVLTHIEGGLRNFSN
jgi:hypothetical protein